MTDEEKIQIIEILKDLPYPKQSAAYPIALKEEVVNKAIKALEQEAENEIFKILKDEGRIESATLIMNPKCKRIFTEYKLDVDVVFSHSCPENEVYMVNDLDLKNEIKRTIVRFYGGDSE